MGITNGQIAAAKAIQDAAAHDLSPTVRVVAGPGTGKSFTIEERAAWLLGEQGVAPDKIIAVSFTRAASQDLKDRIHSYCRTVGLEGLDDLRVSTLHSLALWILRRTGNLAQYPTPPMILDEWESENIFDAEYGSLYGLTPTRCAEVRLDHEAFWNTGIWNPASLPVPDEPVTQAERDQFNTFYVGRTQTYACVLPGEVVRRCVELIQQGLVEVRDVLQVEQVIIDEVQDLNPCDFEFIDALVAQGVTVFIAGDDDQSVYSFRHAYPEGIQSFVERYPQTGDHVLNECFRCTPMVLQAATSLLNNYSAPGRIPKNPLSLFGASDPPNDGVVLTRTLNTAEKEAQYIANSCASLIASGISPADIMILLGNKRAVLKPITDALDATEGISYDVNRKEDFIESNCGRFAIGCLRIVSNSEDYVAHRVLLGTRNGVGIRTCTQITDAVIGSNLNFRQLFHGPLPNGVFNQRGTTAISYVRATIEQLEQWTLNDTLEDRRGEIAALLTDNFNADAANEWEAFVADLPDAMNLGELRDYFYGSSGEYRAALLKRVRERLELPEEVEAEPVSRIRLMTFHSSKGLSAKVVFIPALEEIIFPTRAMAQSPGKIFEAARLLYVAITRAKAACILSRSYRRIVQGQSTQMTPSRFCLAVNRPFSRELNTVMSQAEIDQILEAVTLLD